MSSRRSKVLYVEEEDQIVSELTEEDKRTVEKFQRQLSSHSVLSIRSREGALDTDKETGPEVEEISEEEALRLQRVIQAFKNYKKVKETESIDLPDGKKYRRLSSSQSNEFFFIESPGDSRFVNPGRFHVFFTEESKALVREVNDIIQRGKNTIRRTQSTEVLVVQNQELGQSYYANQGHANASIRDNNRHLHPDDVKIKINDQDYYNGRIPNNWSNIGRGFPRENNTFANRNGHAMPSGGHADLGFVTHFPPKRKFRWAIKRVIQLNREEKKRQKKIQKRKDYFEKFWKRRGDVGWWYLLLCLAGPIAFIADSVTDLKVASDHFSTGHPWWGTFTVMLVFFPTILLNIVSYFFYKDDEEHAHRKPESGWKAVKITHFLQLGLIER